MAKKPSIIISSCDLVLLERQLETANLSTDVVDALQAELVRARIVKPDKMPKDVVSIGSRVTFKLLETQQELTKTLCFPADLAKHQDGISLFAPIGSALLGLKTGQSISWQTPKGPQAVEIMHVQGKSTVIEAL
jgi:regulator of nucleoside diphosphate kinase